MALLTFEFVNRGVTGGHTDFGRIVGVPHYYLPKRITKNQIIVKYWMVLTRNVIEKVASLDLLRSYL